MNIQKSEMGMPASKMADRYSETVHDIAECLICVCLYPDSLMAPLWKDKAKWACRDFAVVDIAPLERNQTKERYECLYTGLIERFDEDFGALRNCFKSTIAYYALKPENERIMPYKPLEESYAENKDVVKDCLISLTEQIAAQDYEKIIDLIDDFHNKL